MMFTQFFFIYVLKLANCLKMSEIGFQLSHGIAVMIFLQVSIMLQLNISNHIKNYTFRNMFFGRFFRIII